MLDSVKIWSSQSNDISPKCTNSIEYWFTTIFSIDKTKPRFLEFKYNISGTQLKKQLPIFKGGSAKDLLYFLREFMEAKGKLGYNQKMESGLEQLLLLSAWNTIKATVQSNTNTSSSLVVKIDALWRLYIPKPAAIEN